MSSSKNSRDKRAYNNHGARDYASNYGERHEKNIVVNKLPEVGDTVIVMRKITYKRPQEGKTWQYKASDSYYIDGHPATFTVKGYTESDPLSKRNRVILYHEYPGGRGGFTVPIQTIHIATGSMYLQVVNGDDVDKFLIDSILCGYSIAFDFGAEEE